MKIKKIETVESEDVYNMEVETHHNFAINGGFIVHNCDALRYFCIMRQRPTEAQIKPRKSSQYSFEVEEDESIMGGELSSSYMNMGR